MESGLCHIKSEPPSLPSNDHKSSRNISLPSANKNYQALTMCRVNTDVATALMLLLSSMEDTQEFLVRSG
jgi:hypothetical protein